MTDKHSAPDSDAVRAAWETAQTLREEIGKALIGQQAVLDQVLLALFAAGHVLLEGVPGLGKTLLVRALAQSIDSDIDNQSDEAAADQPNFGRVQFTSDLMPSDVTGHAIYDLQNERFRLRRGPVFCHFLLADEINRAPAKTQAALLEVMQESQVTIEGTSHPLAPPFMVLATQNPLEQEGTYPLPEAQLDRFLLNILIDYPGHEDELELVAAVTTDRVGDRLDVSRLQPRVRRGALLAAQRTAAGLAVDRAVLDYAVRVVSASRDHPGVAVGAGPRGSIALIRAARGLALLAGRDYVTPDDIKQVARPVLRHRLLLSPELEMEGRRPDDLIDDLIARVDAPRS